MGAITAAMDLISRRQGVQRPDSPAISDVVAIEGVDVPFVDETAQM
jgi:hypothetical protein